MGLAIARTFGAQGYKVALVSRHPAKQDSLIATLAREGIDAEAFRADVLDRASITSGLADVKRRFGPVDVLEYSPADPGVERVSVSQLTHNNIQTAFDFNLHGAFAAVQAVLPDMQARRTGTILFTTGASSVYPHMANDIFEIFANFRHNGCCAARLCLRASRGAGRERHTGRTRRDWRVDRKAPWRRAGSNRPAVLASAHATRRRGEGLLS